MIMKPFFSFYGMKWSLSRYYPEPVYGTIVEPFCGGAGYSTWHGVDREIKLYDTDPIVVSVWQYLIESRPKDILDLPLEFECVDSLDIPFGAKNLLGFWIARGRSTPAKSKSAWCRSGVYTTSFWSRDKRQRLALQVPYIKHWTCEVRDYSDVPNEQATWFIDPPYSNQGIHYRHGNKLDYKNLGCYCCFRKGQVIVCEQDPAHWLPFQHFKNIRGVKDGGKKYSTEVMYTQ